MNTEHPILPDPEEIWDELVEMGKRDPIVQDLLDRWAKVPIHDFSGLDRVFLEWQVEHAS